MIDKWMMDQITQWESECPNYKERAFLKAARELLQEQSIRIEQQKGQLDGQLWSPKEW